jgi:hypothetical protein
MINVFLVNSNPDLPISNESMMIYLQDDVSNSIVALSCVNSFKVGQRNILYDQMLFEDIKNIPTILTLSMNIGTVKLISKEELDKLKK